MRAALLGTVLALVVAGCASSNPVAPQGFDTKLLNLYSIGTQGAGQTNYVPNAQSNFANQLITSNSTASFPVASAVGTGAAVGVNLTGQGLLNLAAQIQPQNQLVL